MISIAIIFHTNRQNHHSSCLDMPSLISLITMRYHLHGHTLSMTKLLPEVCPDQLRHTWHEAVTTSHVYNMITANQLLIKCIYACLAIICKTHYFMWHKHSLLLLASIQQNIISVFKMLAFKVQRGEGTPKLLKVLIFPPNSYFWKYSNQHNFKNSTKSCPNYFWNKS